MVHCECGAVLPPNATAKQLKQHLKSITHKRFLQQAALAKPAAGATAAAAKDADAAAATVDRQDDDSELHALRELCGPDAPDALLQPYAVNRQHYRMLCSSAALLPLAPCQTGYDQHNPCERIFLMYAAPGRVERRQILSSHGGVHQIEAIEPRQGASVQGGGELRGACVAHVHTSDDEKGHGRQRARDQPLRQPQHAFGAG